ncbi:acyl-CoA thioesterase [Microbacterium sp. NPDC055910]|uniref:acyl-CoA thioesterase n=1 Tax=Microbacterium sp. NPDC055910 TaxID=3345659 RepID=UPI0035E059C7
MRESTPATSAKDAAPADPGGAAFATLREVLKLTPRDGTAFTGAPLATQGRVPYGGLLVAQALSAATQTTRPELLPRSLHAYFVGTGRADLPVDIEVEVVRDSASSAWRCVEVLQDGNVMLRAETTFSIEREGPAHQDVMPAAPPPTALPNVGEQLGAFADTYRYWDHRSAFDLRYVTSPPRLSAERGERDPHSMAWMRAGDAGRMDPREAAPLLAFASDMCMLDACLKPHGLWFGDGSASGLSLDHSLWFHGPARVDDWMLMDLRSPAMHGGRGLGIADVFSRDGRILCTIAQQGSIRPPRH